MIAYLVLFAAVLSRLLPHAFHVAGLNFTAVGGSLLFFGARRPRWQTVFAVLALMASDVYLTVFAYHTAFHVRGYVVTWAWYAGVILLGHELLRKPSVLKTALAVLTSATGFYVLIDLAVWAGGNMYPHTAAGLEACYVAAIPFLWNDLVSTAITATVLFGLPVLATKLVEAMQAGKEAPLA
jgi:hypothetical protein